MSALRHIVYLHGFRSSPRSAKAQAMASWAQAAGLDWYCPQLPPSPAAAMALVHQRTEAWPDEGVALLGSYGVSYAGAWITAMGGVAWLATTVAGVLFRAHRQGR